MLIFLWIERELFIEGKFKSIIKHPGQEYLKEMRALLDTGVGITFNEPYCKVCIHHEIKAQNFKTAFPLFRVKLSPNRLKSLNHQIFHIFDQVLIDIYLQTLCYSTIGLTLIVKVVIYVFLKIFERELIAIFILAILCRILLHCIVCQVNHLIFTRVYLIL